MFAGWEFFLLFLFCIMLDDYVLKPFSSWAYDYPWGMIPGERSLGNDPWGTIPGESFCLILSELPLLTFFSRSAP